VKLRCRIFGHKMIKIEEFNNGDWKEECLRCGDIQIWGHRIQVWNVNLSHIDKDVWIRPNK